MSVATAQPGEPQGALRDPVAVGSLRARTALLRSLASTRTGVLGAAVVGLVLAGAIVAWLGLTPFDPVAQRPLDRLKAPSGTYWLGTDIFGRDVFSRSVAGAASSVRVAVVAVGISAIVGTVLGLASGYFRSGLVRGPVLGLTNILFAFPPLLLALALASAFNRNWFTIAVAIAIVYIPIFVRVVRGPVLTLRETDFVAAAQTVGMRTSRILLREILPNLAPIIIVQVTLSLSWAVLTEASLSFLGLGTPPPAPSLGSMVLEARVLVTSAWWTMVGPGALLVLLVIGLNLLGDALRDVLDPRRSGGPA